MCRQWREVARAHHSDASNAQVPVQIRKHYCRLLLAYERELTRGVPSRSISKPSSPDKKRKPKSAQAAVADQAPASASRAAATAKSAFEAQVKPTNQVVLNPCCLIRPTCTWQWSRRAPDNDRG